MFSKFFQKDFKLNELHKLKIEIQELINKETFGIKEHLNLIDLTLSNPTLCNFDYSIYNLGKIFSNSNNYKYNPSPSGSEDLRQAIYSYYENRLHKIQEHFNFEKNNLFFTSGTSESYSHLFKIFCNPGDNIIIPKPGYPLIYYLAEINNLKTKYYKFIYKENHWSINFKSLEKSINKKTKCIIAINPNNPTGNYIKKEEFDRLLLICEENNLPLIIDEVFFDYQYEKAKDIISFHEFKNYNIPIFILNGLSKTAGLPQMKLGWIYFTANENNTYKIRNALEFICDTYLSVNTPIINATPEILEKSPFIQNQIKERIKTNFKFLEDSAKSEKKIKLLGYEGGWYCVIKIKGKIDDDNFALKLLEEKYVFIHPGYFYDFEKDGYIVISLILPEQVFKTGIERILQFLN